MTKLIEILGSRAFAEHLLHGIARNDMSQHEHKCDDEPERGYGKQNSQRDVADHLRRRPLAGPAGARCSTATGAAGTLGSDGGLTGGAGAGRALIFTRETRRGSISITVKR